MGNLLIFYRKHRILCVSYVVWLLLHSLLWICSYAKGLSTGYISDAFFPFNQPIVNILEGYHYYISIDNWDAYDFIEFLTYVLIIPAVIFGIIEIYQKTNKKKESVQLKKDNEIDNEISSIKVDAKDESHHAKASSVDSFFIRLFASICDKTAIIAITAILFFIIIIISPQIAGDFGVYSALLHMSTEEIYNCAIGSVLPKYPGDLIVQHKSEVETYFCSLRNIDIIYSTIFVFINTTYFYLAERKWGASLFKHIFKMELHYNGPNNEDVVITNSRILLRSIVFCVMMMLMILLRWIIGINYYGIIIVFFIILDLPVVFVKRSLLDIITGTKYIIKDNVSFV